MKTIIKISILMVLFTVLNTDADIYYLAAGHTSAQSWNTLTTWTNSAGINPSAILATDDYDINGFAARTPTAANPVFGGKSLTISGNGGLLLKQSATATVTNLISTGGNIVLGNTGTQTLHVVNFSLNGYTRLTAAADRTMVLNIDILTGIQTIKVGANSTDSGLYSISINNASGFTGTIQSAVGTTDFNNPINLSHATYEIVTNNNATVILDQDIIVGSLKIGETVYAAGTYTFEVLNTAFDAQFVDGGTGSITVIPEPRTMGLFVISLAAFFRRLCV